MNHFLFCFVLLNSFHEELIDKFKRKQLNNQEGLFLS